MILYYKNDKQLSLENFYEMYQKEEPQVCFYEWMMHQITMDEVICVEGSVSNIEQFQSKQIEKRKEKLKELVAVRYLRTLEGKNKKQKNQMKKRYLSSDRGREDVERLQQQDPEFLRLLDENSLKEEYAAYVESMNRSAKKRCGRQITNFEEQELRKYYMGLDVDSILEDSLRDCVHLLQEKLDNVLEHEKLYVQVVSQDEFEDLTWTELSAMNLEDYLDQFEDDPNEMMLCCLDSDRQDLDYTLLDRYIVHLLFEHVEELKFPGVTDCDEEYIFRTENGYRISDFVEDILERMNLTSLHILSCIIKNERYHTFALRFYNRKRKELDKKYLEAMEYIQMMAEKDKKDKLIHQSILSIIPDSYPDLYPMARQIRRKFILHVGPTNSGKTYQAMQILRSFGSGAYFAPLRLLAYEQYENLNKDGYPCNLITGEEKTIVPFAKFQASTIEMADFTRTYTAAVIDEAQMIADRDRGGAWTAAILGLVCPEIHVCCSPAAVDILITLIGQCGDDYEIVKHQRNTPLIWQTGHFVFPDFVQEGDALIVFSKRNVHAVASELQRNGKRCSIIYGNLPYDVRQEEARKFLEHETEVVVATDAIGMGMNLPIHRIVFLETEKFDGVKVRPLREDEIAQIAGRAGRKGMFEEGYVACQGSGKLIRQGLNNQVNPIKKAIITFPESLVGIPAELSDTLKRWDQIPVANGYEKSNIKNQIQLCLELESLSDDKELIYRFIMIPFDAEDYTLKKIWMEFFRDEQAGRAYNYRRFLPELYDRNDASYLDDLEEDYHICDLLYSYMDKFHGTEDFSDIITLKREISERIMQILATQKMKPRRCKRCGIALPWNHPYGLCEICYEKQRGWWYGGYN